MDRQVIIWAVPSPTLQFLTQWGVLCWDEWLEEECARVRGKGISAFVKVNGGGRMALFVKGGSYAAQ